MSFDLEDFKQKIRRELNIEYNTYGEIKSLDDNAVKRIAKPLKPYLAKKIGKKVSELNKCITKISITKNPDLIFNACQDDEEGTFQIFLSESLMLFNHCVVKLFVSKMCVTKDNGTVAERTIISDEEMIVAATKLMTSFWDYNLVDSVDFMKLNKTQLELAAFLLNYLDSFVLAHEFGHIVLKSCPEEIGEEIYTAFVEASNKGEPILKPLGLNDRDESLIIRKWAEEMTADLIGLQLILELGENNAQRFVIFSSAELALIMRNMLEQFYEKTRKHSYWLSLYENFHKISHPPTMLRLEFMHSIVEKSNPPSVLELGKAFMQMSDYILSRVH